MAEANETIADIIAEMRYKKGAICPWQVNGGTCESCPLGHSPHGKDLWKYCSFHKLAHELEAAHKREVDEVAGLATKYRTALARINALATYCRQPNVREQIIEQCENIFAEERDGKTKGTEVKK